MDTEPCPTGKINHASRRAALKAGRHRTLGARVRVYLCPVCRHWHVTTHPIDHTRKSTR